MGFGDAGRDDGKQVDVFENCFEDNVLPDEVLNALFDEQENAECPEEGSLEVDSSSNQAPNRVGKGCAVRSPAKTD